MSRIKVMSKVLASRIAAGEVIERPASVVKELVENSIDAGATEISVEIERAGSRLIAVTDNGCGMDDDDAVLALQQHGTSKLLDESDLENIMTLGFRGEALPSIASVSRFTLITRQPDSASGIRIDCDSGDDITSKPHGGASGTRIEVRDLFCNLPARKKFLKSPATEEHHIEEIFSMMAVAHPEISFKLIADNRPVILTPGSGKIEFRLREIFGKNFVDNMLFFEHCEGSIHISGCVAAPGFTRPSRKDQRVFINSRPVEAQAVFRGIKDGYGTLSEHGRYNPVVMFIEMPTDELDVNVHPAKREVRFKSEYAVTRAVAAAVSGALRQTREAKIPEKESSPFITLSGRLPLTMVLDSAEISYSPSNSEQPELISEKTPVSVAFVKPSSVQSSEKVSENDPPEIEIAVVSVEKNTLDAEEKAAVQFSGSAEIRESEKSSQIDIPPVSPLVKPVSPAAFSGIWPHRIIGVIDNTYILAENANGLVLVDQHAAHERIMFEKILANLNSKKSERQQLLIPETIELSRAMITLLSGNKDLFGSLGFDIESAGGTSVIISSVPMTPAGHRDLSEWIHDMLDEIIRSVPPASAVPPANAAKAACKAAVKAHDQLSMQAMESLLNSLAKCRQGTLCPHGRPTMIEISVRELERRFGRK